MTTAQDGGKVVSHTHRPHLPPENTPEAESTPEGSDVFMSMKKIHNTIWD
jgi:hypothetical protein